MSNSLKAGDSLPSVGLRATDGYLLNLRSWVGKQPVLLLFFGGPTLSGDRQRRATEVVEALSADHARLNAAGIAAVGISIDSEQAQAEYAKAHRLPFLLLSDERRSAAELLGIDTTADGENINVARPVAVAVDAEGTITAVIDPIDPPSLVDRAIRLLSVPLPTAPAGRTEDASVGS